MNAWIKRVAGRSWQETPAEICTLLGATGFTRVEVRPVPYRIRIFAIIAE
jgi:hypothetical protein